MRMECPVGQTIKVIEAYRYTCEIRNGELQTHGVEERTGYYNADNICCGKKQIGTKSQDLRVNF